MIDTLSADEMFSLIEHLREQHRATEDLYRAKQRIELQVKAIKRRMARAELSQQEIEEILALDALEAGVIGHLQTAWRVLHDAHNKAVRELERLARLLPVYTWVESVRGFGAKGLGQIVGECGDLWKYDGPAKMWKRMGLGLVDGERQRAIANDAELATRHGYNPRRRAIMYVIGDSLIKGNKADYYGLYVARKAYEQEQHPEWAPPPAGSKRPNKHPAYYHRRAQRYLEKRLLRDLWRAWRAYTTRPEHDEAIAV